MSQVSRNLLFGLLALQNQFISRQQLVEAFGVWVADKSRSIEDILTFHGAMASNVATLLNLLVDQHVVLRDQDVHASLRAMSSVASVRDELSLLGDGDLNASLAFVADVDSDPYKTKVVGHGTFINRRFEIKRPLGRGGLGVVSIAMDNELNREVALKEIRSDLADEDFMRRKFLLEAEVTGNLEHPGIVPVYGLGVQSDGRPYYAMRFVRGDNLAVHIKVFHRRFEEGTEPFDGPTLRGLLRRFLDICEAVSYAHARGVLHRDLKPGNIMLGRFGETLVVDWGLAKTENFSGEVEQEASSETPIVPKLAESDETRIGSAIGTALYAPPEQLNGRLSEIDQRSDVYGLGAILCELLCNQPPATGETIEEILSLVNAGRVPSPRKRLPAVPASLSTICMKSLSPNRDDRYQSAKALMHDVEAWLDDLPVSAVPEGWPSRTARWMRKNRPVALALAGGLMAVSMVSIAAAWTTNRFRVVAEREREIATKHSERAEHYFIQARQAVDKFLTNVSEDPQLALPGFQPTRKRLLSLAMDYYAEFASDPSGYEDDLQRQSADAQFRVAKIHALLGQYEEANVAVESAMKDYANYYDNTKPNPANALDWAECKMFHAELMKSLGRRKQCRESVAKIIEDLEVLAKDFPANDRFEHLLASSLELFGSLSDVRAERAIAYDAASKYRQAIAKRRPSSENVTRLASTNLRMASEHSELRDFKAAIATCQQALAAIDQSIGKDQSFDALEVTGNIQHLLAVAHASSESTNDLALAVDAYKKAVELRQELVSKNSVVAYQSKLAKSYSDLANVLKVTGQNKQAAAAAEHALEINEQVVRYFPEVVDYQSTLCDSLLASASYEANNQSAMRKCIRARDTLRELIVENKARLGLQLQLANAYIMIARCYSRDKKYDVAMENYRESREVRQRLVEQKPSDFQFRRALAASDVTIATELRKTKEWSSAEDSIRLAVKAYEQLLTEKPEDIGTRRQLVSCYSILASVLLDQSRVEPSAETLDLMKAEIEMIRKYDNQANLKEFEASRLHILSDVQRVRGQLHDSVATARQRLEMNKRDPVALLLTAKSIARCVTAAKSEVSVSPNDRDMWIQLVIEQLRTLDKLGFKKLEEIQQSLEFQILVEHPEYDAIIQSIKDRIAAPLEDVPN